MKKVFLSILTLIYMTVSSGIAMEIHFCIGKETGTDFYASSGNTCGRCGMKEKKGGCCSDQHKFVKLSDEHKTAPANFYLPVVFNETISSLHAGNLKVITFHKAALPLELFADSGPPLYVSNRVFRI